MRTPTATVLAASIAAAAVVQAGAWQLARKTISREQLPHATTVVAAVQVVRLWAPFRAPETRPSATATATATATAAAAAAAAATAAAPVPSPSTHPVAAPRRTPPPAPAAVAAAPGEEGGGASAFYEYGEVDVPAEPVGEWNLDPAALDALATSKIVFTLFVASDGTILHCRIDAPDHLGAEARRALEARLTETPLRAARRGGVAVASRRRVELFTEGGL